MRCLIGQKFQMLFVKSKAILNRHGDIFWECLCDCTNRRVYWESYKIDSLDPDDYYGEAY